MKRTLALVLAILLLSSALAELDIVCSIFPQYDFTRRIAGEYASVTQLLPAGMDSHEYEPSPREVLACDRADLFIYTDDEMEPWLSSIKGSLENVTLVRCADSIDLVALNEEWEKMSGEEEEEHEHEGHHHSYDAHIWLDPTLAVVMCENIASALCEKDPEHADTYKENCAALVSELNALDEKYTALFAAHPGCTLYFGGKFAYSHFLRRYNVDFVTAYSDCSDEGEPGMRVILEIVREISSASAKVIFTDEMSSGEVAEAIAEEAGCEVLLFHSCHNLTKKEEGLSYLELMDRNYDNIARALGE